MTAEARKKRHSTISEAVRVGTDMRAERIVLTHFSQRFPRFPKNLGSARNAKERILVAFDLMRVDFRDILVHTRPCTHVYALPSIHFLCPTGVNIYIPLLMRSTSLTLL
jgi:hypothetical protein